MRKPRRWVERLRTTTATDVEHAVFLRDYGLERYIEEAHWLKDDVEMGEVNHPGIIYGRIYPPRTVEP